MTGLSARGAKAPRTEWNPLFYSVQYAREIIHVTKLARQENHARLRMGYCGFELAADRNSACPAESPQQRPRYFCLLVAGSVRLSLSVSDVAQWNQQLTINSLTVTACLGSTELD